VQKWRDLSGHTRDAVPPAGQPGPLCGASAATIEGHPVVTFPRDATYPSGEYLEVDLAAIVDRPFSIAIVELRRGDGVQGAWLLGSRLPYPASLDCGPVNLNASEGLAIGYPGPFVFVATVWGPNCDILLGLPPPAARPNGSLVVFAPGTGITLFSQELTVGPVASEGLKRSQLGFIGRGFDSAVGVDDSRFAGDIAEIVIFDVALTTDQRKALQGYFRASWNNISWWEPN
jgi:hypothetical protein